MMFFLYKKAYGRKVPAIFTENKITQISDEKKEFLACHNVKNYS